MSDPCQEYKYFSADMASGENGLKLSQKIIKLIGQMHGIKKICELGCGNGYLANEFSKLGYEVCGVDSSESGIDLAKKNYGEKINFLRGEIDRNISRILGQEKFDLVVASEVLEHLYRPSDLIEASEALLKKGGYLLLTTPYHGYLKNLAIAIANRVDAHVNPLWDCGHIKFFSVKTLSILISRYPFEDVTFHFWGRAPWLWKNMICIAKKNA